MRHAQSEFNVGLHRQPDPRLTVEGTAQATKAAELLAGQYTHILTTPYRRALHTATILSKGTIPISVDPMAGEHVAGEAEEGSPISEMMREWPALNFEGIPERWWPAPRESDESLAGRVRAFLAWASAHNTDGLLVVTHWGFLRAMFNTDFGNCQAVMIERKAA